MKKKMQPRENVLNYDSVVARAYSLALFNKGFPFPYSLTAPFVGRQLVTWPVGPSGLLTTNRVVVDPGS